MIISKLEIPHITLVTYKVMKTFMKTFCMILITQNLISHLYGPVLSLKNCRKSKMSSLIKSTKIQFEITMVSAMFSLLGQLLRLAQVDLTHFQSKIIGVLKALRAPPTKILGVLQHQSTL